MAIGAHPDDIEFMMAGTLALLKHAGYETHYMNVANGCCGSAQHTAAETRRIRGAEARVAARLLGAKFHPSLVDDLDIYYERTTLRRLASVIRSVAPTILLVPSPQDYMEDHTNVCRLAVSAAFTRGMGNFRTTPSQAPVEGDVTVYHAMPHGLRDPLRRVVVPGAFVNTETVFELKQAALLEHKSQQHWLGESQKMSHYLKTQERFSLALGRMSKRFKHAEGWRRHLHYGFCPETAHPLKEALGRNCRINMAYEKGLGALD